MRKIQLGKEKVTQESQCYVIAEIGNNHGGKVKTALKMIKSAKDCGANAVKFQRRNNKDLFTKKFYASPYSSYNSFAKSYGLHRDYLEMPDEDYQTLIDYAKDLEIEFFATAFEEQSLEFLETKNLPFYKVASGDIFNFKMLKMYADIGKPIIISTGGCTSEDIKKATDFLNSHNFDNYTLLQCTASYPCDFEYMNLDYIKTLLQNYPDKIIGLSDHNRGIALPIYAYALGARIIERHFTLDRTQKGTDHAFSLEPGGLRKMIRDLHNVRISKGDGIKTIYDCEIKPLEKMRKSIYLNNNLKKGDIISEKDLSLKCPYVKDAFNGQDYYELIGKKILRSKNSEEPLSKTDI
jgi:sialic acid synthase